MGVFLLSLYGYVDIRRYIENMSQSYKDSHFGLVIGDNEKNELYRICTTYHIPITFPDLFQDDKPHYMWSFSKDGIGLAGTCILRHYSMDGIKIFHGVKELEAFLVENHW